MPTFGEFMFGLVVLGAGIVMTIYARKIVDWFGTSATFERYLGSGGTYTGLRIVGVLCIVIGLLLMIGKLDDSLSGIFKSLTK